MSLRRSAIAVVAALAVAVSAAAAPAVQKLLPGPNTVKGFAIMRDSLVYGKGNDIAKIYDGGFELYTKNGVIDAARQMYYRGDDYVEVTVHSMKSDKAALDFLKYWQKENKVRALVRSGGSTGFLVTKPSVSAHFVQGKYYVTVSAFHAAEKAVKDVGAFQRAILESLNAKRR